MQIYELIKKKRSGGELSKEELSYLITGYLQGTVPEYQISAFLMAVFFKGMTEEETYQYTDILLHSGKIIDLKLPGRIPVDKHSTGGVGDKVSIPLVPLVAAAGVPVPMLSGRGLGHTGGTLDKLESIPGFRVNLSCDEFVQLLRKNNMAMMGQTADIVPADKKLYALRDVTGTVESLPLIVGSILSKKLAEGANGIVFDVKFGIGAFMRRKNDAILLANALVKMSRKFKRKAVALVTDMEQPLGHTIGNSLEIRESIELLQGKGPKDLELLVIEFGAYMVWMAKAVRTVKQGRDLMKKLISDGTGLEWFKKMVEAQGGNPAIVEQPELLPKANNIFPVHAPKSGHIHSIDALAIGQCAVQLGAGRERLDSIIDPAVGFVLSKKVGDPVKKDELLATIHYNDVLKKNIIIDNFKAAFTIKPLKPRLTPLIIKVID